MPKEASRAPEDTYLPTKIQMHECKNSVRAACSIGVFLGVQCVRICICIDRLAFFFLFWQFCPIFSFRCFCIFFLTCLFGCSSVPSPSAEKERPSLGASASFLFLSFSVCVVRGLYFYFFRFWPVSVCFVGLVLSERLFRSDSNPHCRQGLSSCQGALQAFRSWVPSKALHLSRQSWPWVGKSGRPTLS